MSATNVIMLHNYKNHRDNFPPYIIIMLWAFCSCSLLFKDFNFLLLSKNLKMSWKGMLWRIFRTFVLVFSIWFLINLITQSHINCYGEKGKHSHNDSHRTREAIRRVYSLENLVPPEVALKIGNIWKDELSQFTWDENRTMTNQMIQAGGQPERLLLVSKWRSGSSYFGSVLRSRPGTHYFFEPLHNKYSHFAPEVPDVALQILRNVFQCRYLDQHVMYASELCYFSRNSDLMSVVLENELEWDPNFLTVMCRVSPILAVKVVLLRLRHVEALLEDENIMGESQLTKWTRRIGQDMDLLSHIQNACAEAMDLWAYIPVSSLPTNLSNILKSSVNQK